MRELYIKQYLKKIIIQKIRKSLKKIQKIGSFIINFQFKSLKMTKNYRLRSIPNNLLKLSQKIMLNHNKFNLKQLINLHQYLKELQMSAQCTKEFIINARN